ncbi:hypothetical protein M1367_03470 [Candidatus Marsarchaeota archaeon]|jgi:hypothetical protein|nr:hypothetical protein [Candidatus Marsarchaeota archaeon]
MAKSKKFVAAGKEAAAAGRFGEAYIAHLLAKKGVVDVVQANSSGFDLLAVDKKGRQLNSANLSFRKGMINCISVKDRKFHSQIPLGYNKLKEAAKTWNADPWFGIVISNPPKLNAYLIPLEDARKFSSYSSKKKDYLLSEPRIRDKKYTLATYAEEALDGENPHVRAGKLAWQRHRDSLLRGIRNRSKRA